MSSNADRLEIVLTELLEATLRWNEAAMRHGSTLPRASREGFESVAELEMHGERVALLEERRQDICRAWAMSLGMPVSEALPPLSHLLKHLDRARADQLAARAAALREAVEISVQQARRNAALAEAGRKVAAGTLERLTRLVAARQKTPAAYGRDGRLRGPLVGLAMVGRALGSL